MQRLTFILLALVAVCAHGGRIMPSHVPALDGQIVGGEATTIEEFPYQVSVRLIGWHICSGTILTSRHIVTAAHCIYSFMGAAYYSIQYGTTVIGGTNNVIKAESTIKHEDYNWLTRENNIAIIILSSDIPFSASAQPIAVATETPAAGTLAVVSGWRTLREGGSLVSVLHRVDVNIIDSAQCQDSYPSFNFTLPILCAGDEDACQSDSGAPLVNNNTLVGVVSWGVSCYRPGYHGVFTDSVKHSVWIKATIDSFRPK